MKGKEQFYVVKEKAVPEVLLKVVEAKKLLETGKAATVQEAADLTGISRSSFYKYKDDISLFHENTKGKKITFVIQMNDQPGLLSDVLKVIAEYQANILTIHQTIPVNGVASLTLCIDILPTTGNSMSLFTDIENLEGVHYMKISSERIKATITNRWTKDMDMIKKIASELEVQAWQVEAAVKLIDEGNTIPFIARYRKEATGTLNDEQLRKLHERLVYLRNLEEKKQQVLSSIEEQGKLTEELKKQILEAQTQVLVEDLYRPYRPKTPYPCNDCKGKRSGRSGKYHSCFR